MVEIFYVVDTKDGKEGIRGEKASYRSAYEETKEKEERKDVSIDIEAKWR